MRSQAIRLGIRARELSETVQATQRRNTTLRDWSGAIRATRPILLWTGGTPVRWMRVEGNLLGRAVWAWWHQGRLSGDRALLEHARLLVEMGAVFANDDPPALVMATLDGPPADIMLTLAHACDRVTSVEFQADRA